MVTANDAILAGLTTAQTGSKVADSAPIASPTPAPTESWGRRR
jgi:hypothetical protein